MGLLIQQVDAMEAGLRRLQTHIPHLPMEQALISRLLVHLGRELSAMIDQRLRPYGLSDIEFRTLMLVYSHRDSAVFPSELCTGLAQSPANVTRLTDALLARGLITRVPDAEDRRRLVLRATAQGTELVEALLPLMITAVNDSYQSFSPAQLQQLLNSLKQLAGAIDQVSESNIASLASEAQR